MDDGVDYVRFSIVSEKGAPLADYEPCDGTMRMCLDEMWDQVKDTNFLLAEANLIALFIDVYSHELHHKWFCWGMGNEMTESFNEQDERMMRVCFDWIERGKLTTLVEYDYK